MTEIRELAVKTDKELSGLLGKLGRLEERKSAQRNEIHRIVGDQRSQRRYTWCMTDAEAEAMARLRVQAGDDTAGRARAAIEELDAIEVLISSCHSAISVLQAVHARHRWNRYFLVTNDGGHVHSSTGCSTCYASTSYSWLVDLAAQPVADMIAEWGERACTVCFPDAPSNPDFRRPARIDREAREAREAEKAQRNAARDAKRLAPAEVFRTRWMNDRVETVAACKDLIRKPEETTAELAWYRSDADKPGWTPERLADHIVRMEESLRDQMLDADDARRVLLDREAAHPGWGADQAAIDKMIASARKRAQRNVQAWG